MIAIDVMMNYFKRFLLFIFLIIFNFSFAQEDIDDKLREYEAASLEKKMELFFYFFQKFKSDQKDSVLYYVNDLQNEGVMHGDKAAIALSNFGISPYLLNNSLFDEASEKLEKAEKYYLKVENDTMLADVYNIYGNAALLKGNSAEAEVYYNRSREYAVASGEERFLMTSTFNLGRIYNNRGKFEEAQEMIQEYTDFMMTAGDMRKLAAAYGLMGQLYLDQNNNEKAIDYFTRSMESGLAAGNMTSVANGYTNLAIAEFYSGDKERSEQYFQLALAYRMKEGNKYYIAEGYYNLGDFYYGAGKFDSALVNYSYSFETAEESENLKGQIDALTQLEGTYDTLSQPHNQIAVLRKIILKSSQLAEQQSYMSISALKSNYKQSQNEVINTGGIREDQLQGQVVEYQSIFNNWIWIVTLCVIAFTIFIYFFKRSSKA